MDMCGKVWKCVNFTERVTLWYCLRGAGTDANVYAYLCGEREPGKEIWGPMQKLDDTKNNFERNMADSFLLVKHKNLGQLTRMKIGHDNSGPGPGKCEWKGWGLG